MFLIWTGFKNPSFGKKLIDSYGCKLFRPFPKRQNLDSSKLKEFADDNLKFDENGRKFSKLVENTGGKREMAC